MIKLSGSSIAVDTPKDLETVRKKWGITQNLRVKETVRAFPAHLESLGDSHGCDFVIPS